MPNRLRLAAHTFLVAFSVAPASRAAPPGPAVLDLYDGQFVRGRLLGVQDGVLTWEGDQFARPLRFPLNFVRSAEFGIGQDDAEVEFEFSVRLANFDVLRGEVLSIDDHEIVFRTRHIGELRLPRNLVQRLTRKADSPSPGSKSKRRADKPLADQRLWPNELADVTADAAGTPLFGGAPLPDRAAIELTLEWSDEPDFALYLGADQDRASRDAAFSIETWGTMVAAQRHTAAAADVAPLQETSRGSLQLHLYLDQIEQTLVVYDARGNLLAELSVPGREKQARRPIVMVSRRGEVHIKRFRVRPSAGLLPTREASGGIWIATESGYEVVSSLQLRDGVLISGGEDEPLQLRWDNVTAVDFPVRPIRRQTDFVASYQDGSRISGELVSATPDEMVVRTAVSEAPWRLTNRSLRTLSIDRGAEDSGKLAPPEGCRVGVLEMMDTRLRGWLAEEATADSDASCLAWRAAAAKEPIRLANDA
ncbi:MAG: hypothetical protein AAF961_04145 [Planctomycetota bacterium]